MLPILPSLYTWAFVFFGGGVFMVNLVDLAGTWGDITGSPVNAVIALLMSVFAPLTFLGIRR